MTGAALIVAAVTAGAAAGITDTTSSAIRDGYTGLREALRRRLAARGDRAVQVLEPHEIEPAVWRASLSEDLAATGADRDEYILAAAREVLALLDPAGTRAGKYIVDTRGAKGVQVGDHNTQTNTFS
jgi:hypothetical protein